MRTIVDMDNAPGSGSNRELAAETPRTGDVPADTFAARLLLARHHAGRLSQREAAERCGLNYASWSNWEEGKRPRDLLDIVGRVSAELGIDFNWLLLGGPLLPAKGRPVRRTRSATASYPPMAVRPATPRTDGRPRGASPVQSSTNQPVRRARLVDRSQSASVV